jgi:hypothetical protein
MPEELEFMTVLCNQQSPEVFDFYIRSWTEKKVEVKLKKELDDLAFAFTAQ